MTTFEYVIRTVGERTEAVCIELVNRQKLSDEILHVINEDTHAKAVDRTLRIGIDSSAEWVIAIDADMLLIPEGITAVRKEIIACPKSIAIVHPAVVDKLYRMRRWGLTVYRRKVLPELYDEFTEIRKMQNLKIEGAAIKSLSKRDNRDVLFSRNVAAIHDFYQYYRDLYRKAYLNTIRNPGYNKGLGKFWGRLAKKDDDYLIMYKAMQDAENEKRDLSNSVADFDPAELDQVLHDLGLKEKDELDWDKYIDQCCLSAMETEINLLDQDRIFNDFYENTSMIRKIRTVLYKMRSRVGLTGSTDKN